MSRMNQTHVLFFAPLFYPCQHVGSHRSSQFCKYLSHYNYVVSVVTVDPYRNGWPSDQALNREIPTGTKVINVPLLNLQKIKKTICALYGVFKFKKKVDDQTQENKAEKHSKINTRSRFAEWFNWPDGLVWWIPQAIIMSLGAARQADVLYASAPPHSALVAATIVSRMTHRPIVIDLRDPWTINEIRSDGPTRFHRYWDHFLERITFKSASSIICNTEAVRLLYEKQYPKWREKFIVINNGFDPDGFQGVVPAAREDNRIRIGYFGKIYAGRDPGPLLSVVRKLVDSGRLSSESIEFVFYGASSKQIQGIAQKLNVTDLVAAHPSLPYTKALCEMAACDVLLLINSPETDAMHIPAKLFEYMGLKKPILALAGPGAVGDLMESHHFGVRIDPQEPERLEETLLRFMENIRSGKRNQYLTDELWRFSRPEQTKQLVGLLDNAR